MLYIITQNEEEIVCVNQMACIKMEMIGSDDYRIFAYKDISDVSDHIKLGTYGDEKLCKLILKDIIKTIQARCYTYQMPPRN